MDTNKIEQFAIYGLILVLLLLIGYSIHLAMQNGETQECREWAASVRAGQTAIGDLSAWQVEQCDVVGVPVR